MRLKSNQGGFALYTQPDLRLSLISLNIKSSIPYVPFLKLYSNLAIYSAGNSYDNYKYKLDEFSYELGVVISFLPNRFEIYLPLIASENIWDYNNTITDNTFQKIRFVFNLHEIQKTINQLL